MPWKGFVLKKFFALLFLGGVVFCCGCEEGSIGGGELLVVDMDKDEAVRYRMVSERDVVVDLDPNGTISKGGKSGAKSFYEKLEMEVSVKLLEIDSLGYLNIEVGFDSVKVQRKGSSGAKGRDAAEMLAGKKGVIKMTPAGLIVDSEGFEKVIQGAGSNSFSKGKNGKIDTPVKSVDMVSDAAGMVYYFWDVMSKVDDPLKGVKGGQDWKSNIWLPLPVAVDAGRDVSYKVDKIISDDGGNRAIIKSSISGGARPRDFLKLYPFGKYRQRGFFGVLICKLRNLEGEGEIEFDLDKGMVVRDEQEYEIELKANLFMRLPGMEDRPDALFVLNDNIALQVLDKLCEWGIEAGKDIALTGMGDLVPTRWKSIGLTSAHEPLAEIGAEAAKVVIELIENDNSRPIHRKISCNEIKIRRTTTG